MNNSGELGTVLAPDGNGGWYWKDLKMAKDEVLKMDPAAKDGQIRTARGWEDPPSAARAKYEDEIREQSPVLQGPPLEWQEDRRILLATITEANRQKDVARTELEKERYAHEQTRIEKQRWQNRAEVYKEIYNDLITSLVRRD